MNKNTKILSIINAVFIAIAFVLYIYYHEIAKALLCLIILAWIWIAITEE